MYSSQKSDSETTLRTSLTAFLLCVWPPCKFKRPPSYQAFYLGVFLALDAFPLLAQANQTGSSSWYSTPLHIVKRYYIRLPLSSLEPLTFYIKNQEKRQLRIWNAGKRTLDKMHLISNFMSPLLWVLSLDLEDKFKTKDHLFFFFPLNTDLELIPMYVHILSCTKNEQAWQEKIWALLSPLLWFLFSSTFGFAIHPSLSPPSSLPD